MFSELQRGIRAKNNFSYQGKRIFLDLLDAIDLFTATRVCLNLMNDLRFGVRYCPDTHDGVHYELF
jgi:hypothetical protein